jgi:hypothetical protein
MCVQQEKARKVVDADGVCRKEELARVFCEREGRMAAIKQLITLALFFPPVFRRKGAHMKTPQAARQGHFVRCSNKSSSD